MPFLWAGASPHARVKFIFLSVGVVDDGLHARHFPDDRVCGVLDGNGFSVLGPAMGDLGAEVGDGVALLYFDGVGLGHFFW